MAAEVNASRHSVFHSRRDRSHTAQASGAASKLYFTNRAAENSAAATYQRFCKRMHAANPPRESASASQSTRDVSIQLRTLTTERNPLAKMTLTASEPPTRRINKPVSTAISAPHTIDTMRGAKKLMPNHFTQTAVSRYAMGP